MRNKFKANFFRILLLFLCFVLVAHLPLYYIYMKSEKAVIEELGRSAMNVASTIAAFIERDIEPYRELVLIEDFSRVEYDEGYYREMISLLRKIKKSTGAEYIFTQKPDSPNSVVYILDGEDPESENFSLIGSPDILTKKGAEVIKERTPGYTELIRDPYWGTFLTGYAPIIDTEREQILGLVGVDYSEQQVAFLLRGIKRLVFTIGLLLSLLLALVVNRLLQTRATARDYDYLTGLYSKRFHDHSLKKIMDCSDGRTTKLSLAMMDIDNFKNVNDEHGHLYGDAVLKSVAEIIRENTRNADICSRYGGDEFILILPGTEQEQALKICDRIREKLNNEYSEKPGRITMSVGIVEWNGEQTAPELTEAADKAMYLSKTGGGNKSFVFQE